MPLAESDVADNDNIISESSAKNIFLIGLSSVVLGVRPSFYGKGSIKNFFADKNFLNSTGVNTICQGVF